MLTQASRSSCTCTASCYGFIHGLVRDHDYAESELGQSPLIRMHRPSRSWGDGGHLQTEQARGRAPRDSPTAKEPILSACSRDSFLCRRHFLSRCRMRSSPHSRGAGVEPLPPGYMHAARFSGWLQAATRSPKRQGKSSAIPIMRFFSPW